MVLNEPMSSEDYATFFVVHQGNSILLVVYVDDIITIGDDKNDIRIRRHICNINFTHVLDIYDIYWVLRWHGPRKKIFLS